MAIKAVQAADAEPVETKRDDGSVEVRLHKHIRALDETKTSLVFREPSANDVYEIGDPTRIVYDDKGRGRMEIDDAKMMELMSRLSGVPLGSIKMMKVTDYTNSKWAVASFFAPREQPGLEETNQT